MPDFDLTIAEIRAVTEYALAAARRVSGLLDDPRPRAALDAAALFVDGAPRSTLQRTAALDAHRAAHDAASESAACAAHAAGDACAAAYLHPLAQATQVGHILRASAYAAVAVELADDDPAAGDRIVAEEARRMPAVVLDVLRRYPSAPTGRTRVAQRMTMLDGLLRSR
ncbi:putative immunity protein [Gordonia phthalatica]|uniref:Exonuclease SbcC n=1 Tax=Gordonia phthalatica TaxID=1136941 RepID=A0A0N9NE19_9ACTN|nr:hypothetical protein [Gordonia phthalatica]ALG83462.1 exonuclease SbcC [Gordonia phthalatica]